MEVPPKVVDTPNTARLNALSMKVLRVLSLALVGVESLQYSQARKMLLIHGSGSSRGAFVNSPTDRGAQGFISGVPCRQDAGSSQVPRNWQYAAIDAGSNDGTWYDADGKRLDASVKAVESFIEAQQGQIAGIVGHEQGGLVAAIVAARAALGEGPLTLSFAIICGASMPAAKAYTDLLHRLSDSPGASVPTLHCLSESDAASASGAELASCFEPTAEILWHTRGNAMPDRSWWKSTMAYPDRAVGFKRYVDQYTIGDLFDPSTVY